LTVVVVAGTVVVVGASVVVVVVVATVEAVEVEADSPPRLEHAVANNIAASKPRRTNRP
jgi:hypothetical protein